MARLGCGQADAMAWCGLARLGTTGTRKTVIRSLREGETLGSTPGYPTKPWWG
jgi:hypothetical protein